MRSQLNDIKLIDQYILRELSAEDKLVMDTRMILSPLLRENYHQQFRLHQIVLQHGREKLRDRLNQLHHRLMRNAEFSKKIHSYFK